jgi:hypothetical protein
MHSRVKHFFDDHLLNKAGVPHLIDAQRLGGPDGRLISRSRRVESQSDALFGCIQRSGAVRRSIAGELFDRHEKTRTPDLCRVKVAP